MTWWQALIDAGAVPGRGGKAEEPEQSEYGHRPESHYRTSMNLEPERE